MSGTEWFWVFFGTAVLCAIGMQVPAWLEGRSDRKPASAERAPMSASSKALARNAAWLLCAALLGGFVGGAVASRGGTERKVVSHEYDDNASDISRLESDISSLRSRVSDLESKIER